MKDADDPIQLWRTAKTDSVLARSLSAARGRGPTADQVRELESSVLAAVGGAAAATVGAAPAKGAVGSPGAAASVSAAKVGVVLLVSATVAGTAAGLYWASSRASRARVERSAALSAPPAPPAATAAAPSPSSTASAAPVAASAGSRARATAHPASRATPRTLARADVPAAAAGSSDDVAELQLLSRARRALANDPALALALSDEHQRRFHSGSMEQEREVIAVDALVGLGRLADARSRGERFAHEHAGSPYVARIQQILSRDKPSK